MKAALAFFAPIIFTAYSIAGTIDDNLMMCMENMKDSEKIACRIILSEQFDVELFKKNMTMANSTRAERHAFVINSLIDIASRTQPDLLAYLKREQENGNVDEYSDYWIANVIDAELTKAAITLLAVRSDVDIITLWLEPELIEPIKRDSQRLITTGVESGVEAIGAPEMWELGYTGVGRLVANIDSGVDGYHPALMSRWRGNNGAAWQECWFDGRDNPQDYPYDILGHGTHTMGTISGLAEATGDTIGVAHGASWIAAYSGGRFTEAVQWMIDPDGDPMTIDDVPDVLANCWGVNDSTCPELRWIEIDNLEAAGIVVVFSAGNSGPDAESITAPASRITSPYNVFSVGAVDGNDENLPIADFSSRGPSNCDHLTIKPEVVAPGVNVRSSIPGGGYEGWYGTSMSCPHVAGAVALLRQYNPEATSDTIKWALMQSAIDLGVDGEDNAYGHGIINVRAALDFMPPPDGPFIYVSDYEAFDPLDEFPEPGDDVGLVVTLFNTGLEATNVYAILTSDNPFVYIVNDSSYWGDIGPNESPNNELDPYLFAIAENCPVGYDILFTLDIFADGYSISDDIQIMVHGPANFETADFDFGNCEFTISNFGQYGLCLSDLNHDWPGLGFKTPRQTINYLHEDALLIGNGPTRISNAARDENHARHFDFVPLTTISSEQPGTFADLEYSCSFDDWNADEPLSIIVNQTSYGWADPPDNSYIITVHEIINNGDTGINGLRIAHYEDWDIPWIGFAIDRVNYDRQRNLGYQYYLNFYRGIMVLNDEGACAFKALRNDSEVDPPHFTMPDKWTYMTAGFSDTAVTEPENASMMLTTGPFDIPFGASATSAFAILGASSLEGLQEIADAVRAKYNNMTDIDETTEARLPAASGIRDNYPNPFNTVTIIHYNLSEPATVRLDIYDILGRKIETLVNAKQQAGRHQAVWKAEGFSSGVYFYKFQAGDYTETKKMVILK